MASVLTESGELTDVPVVRKIGVEDLKASLRAGFDDFWAMPTHVVFIGVIYPILGLFLARAAIGYDVLSLLFPLVSGFALVGPLAGTGLYELSRRRELGLDTSFGHAFDPFRSPAIRSIVLLGLVLLFVLAMWLLTAQTLYRWLFGDVVPASVGSFLTEVLTTGHGWALIIVGNILGFCFAAVTFAITVVSFPLLLDRNVGVGVAIQTSLRAVSANPGTMTVWGAVIALTLLAGFVPLFIGLAIAIPVLAHASWHLYRRVVQPAPGAPPVA